MLEALKRPHGAKKRIKIVGRGRGSGHGKTSGRGHKGQNARASGGVRPGFEGGQMPLIRRVPKRGFSFTPKPTYEIVALERLNRFPVGAEVTPPPVSSAKGGPIAKQSQETGGGVTPEMLQAAGLVKKGLPVKILGNGELKKPLTIKAHAFSKSALSKIKSAGGAAQVLGS